MQRSHIDDNWQEYLYQCLDVLASVLFNVHMSNNVLTVVSASSQI